MNHNMDDNNNKRDIKLRLSAEELKHIDERVAQCGTSRNSYIVEMAMFGHIMNSLPEAKLRSAIAILYVGAEQVSDIGIRANLREVADQLWQCLK